MSNAAYTNRYKQRVDECTPLFISDNLKGDEEHSLSIGYSVCVTMYAGKVGEWNLQGGECRLVNSNGEYILEWRSINTYGNFYSVITHGNGKEYLIFTQDLYGYSVFDFSSRQVMHFFPESSLNGEETFIWTSVKYSPETSVLAVSGCYWACPYSTQLFTFENPMSEHQKYLDLRECFGCNYDIYCDVDFEKWENGDLHISRFVNETETSEKIVIKQDEYLFWLNDKGNEL